MHLFTVGLCTNLNYLIIYNTENPDGMRRELDYIALIFTKIGIECGAKRLFLVHARTDRNIL